MEDELAGCHFADERLGRRLELCGRLGDGPIRRRSVTRLQ
ncbi:hypothetical protein JJL56_32700 [Azospirillum sp. YIM DDC1]|uniref:Uncharacterized protein n=1 Tax=Azospirillum aestuarii TaxID=2802052 RepID=A0ABS1I951_9PROT|nr:hypothetical protein [Azospirillum aestuarii]